MFGFLDYIKFGAGAIAGALLATTAIKAYDRLIAYPAVAREARQGYVAESEKTALQGQIDEMHRQFKLAEAAAASDRARAETASKEADNAWKQYEAAVAADTGNDGCRVDAGDLDWLRKSRPAPEGGVQ